MINFKNINSYYNEYKANAESELEKCNKDKREAIKAVNLTRERVKKHLYTYTSKLKIDVENSIEWKTNSYNEDTTNYDKAYNAYMSIKKGSMFQEELIYLLRWYKALERVAKHDRRIDIINNRINMTFTKFKDYVVRYYTQVQIEMLEGHAYSYSNGIGMVYFNRVKNERGKGFKRLLDHAATRRKKAQLLAEGKKLYNKEEAKECQRLGIPYDGHDYLVYLNDDYFYQLAHSDNRISGSNAYKIERSDYRGKSVRGMTNEQIAANCSCAEDVYNLDVDVRLKLNILLLVDSTNYIKFIRNEEQSSYNRRKNSRKDR